MGLVRGSRCERESGDVVALSAADRHRHLVAAPLRERGRRAARGAAVDVRAGDPAGRLGSWAWVGGCGRGQFLSWAAGRGRVRSRLRGRGAPVVVGGIAVHRGGGLSGAGGRGAARRVAACCWGGARAGRNRADGAVLAGWGRAGAAGAGATEVGSARADADRGRGDHDDRGARTGAGRAADRVAQPAARPGHHHGRVHAPAVRAIGRGAVPAHDRARAAVLRGVLRDARPQPAGTGPGSGVRACLSAGLGRADRPLPAATPEATRVARCAPSPASRESPERRRPRRRRR